MGLLGVAIRVAEPTKMNLGPSPRAKNLGEEAKPPLRPQSLCRLVQQRQR